MASGNVNVYEQISGLNYLKNQVKIDQAYGTNSTNAINIDSIQLGNGYIIRIKNEGYLTGTLPTGIGGNAWLLIGFGAGTYGVQMAIGFDSSKIAIRNMPLTGTWGEWKYINAS